MNLQGPRMTILQYFRAQLKLHIRSRGVPRCIYTAAKHPFPDEHEQTLPRFRMEPFIYRHLGPRPTEVPNMLATVGHASMDSFLLSVLPKDLASRATTNQMALPFNALPEPVSEMELRDLLCLSKYFGGPRPKKYLMGQGYYGTHCPAVIKRDLLENPAWYTSYTPYQPEISQGRLESLLNFQTMVSELTGFPIANASLLDEPTAACEAMLMMFNSQRESGKRTTFLVDAYTFPQTIACLTTRAEPLGIKLKQWVSIDDFDGTNAFGMLIQYPDSLGHVRDIKEIVSAARDRSIKVICATDLLALALVSSPGELGADVAIGSAQRFGVPMGLGGPYAAFIACKAESVRRMPGRIVGVARDSNGSRALRLALQTREQHIRRDKATSNICTAQALLANVSAMYGVYHGPRGLRAIAERIHHQAIYLAYAARQCGHELINKVFFDTVVFKPQSGVQANDLIACANGYGIGLRTIRYFGGELISISLDETVTDGDMECLLGILALEPKSSLPENVILETVRVNHNKSHAEIGLPDALCRRGDSFMNQTVFNTYHSETELARYIHELSQKDLSLLHSMIPLGSCTMKLNPAAAMDVLALPAVTNIHPLAPSNDIEGYQTMINELGDYLCAVTGFSDVSFQPNSGAQGELTGLLMIRKYHSIQSPNNARDVCLIPVSAHGTNPASAALAGFKVVFLECSSDGSIDLKSLDEQLDIYKKRIACIMVTYPSTFGVFDAGLATVIDRIHGIGGLVYLDGANMNAQMGLIRPADIGADLCHLNLHKTFCIPHGGGGPGAGPVCVSAALAPYLPRAPVSLENTEGRPNALGPVSGAPYGSASILTISWAYIRLVGGQGLKDCSRMALLNANYMMRRLEDNYRILFRNEMRHCAHEFVLDCRPFQDSAGIQVIDIAKRLQVMHCAS